MKFGQKELLKLRGALLLCVLLAGAGAAAVVFVLKEKKQAALALVAAENKRTQNEMRLRQVSNEEQEIKSKTTLFKNLEARGIIGTENRLDWVELLREVRDRHKLYSAEYEIQPQQKLFAAAGGYDFQSSLMRLDAQLLHEEDLLRLLGDIQREARALVLPRECNVTRLNRAGTSERAGPQPNLSASCTLQWITVRSPEKKS